MGLTSGPALRRERTRHRIEELKRRVEEEVMEQARANPAAAQAKRAMEKAYRWYVCGRRINLSPRFSEEQRFFLRLFLIDLFTREPARAKRPLRAARQIGDNYPFYWITSDVTRLARVQARDMILQSAESGFGDTPFDGPLGYVICHHDLLGILDVTSYGEMYSRAVTLKQEGVFNDLTTVVK